uniref:Uncharacterized protein n=1 Tax=uncultured crenarchaeote TaxID=29281 RepID=Q2V9D8_9CREN|nr:protein of unknown function [uncultured crenarchaeote]
MIIHVCGGFGYKKIKAVDQVCYADIKYDGGTLTSRYHFTSTPFQNAIYPLIFVAASDGSG